MEQLILMCGTPFLALAILIAMFTVLGLLIDPQGMIDWYNDLKKFYFNK